MSTGSIQMQLESQIRQYIGKYYEGWASCDDPTCGHRTHMMGVYGRRCLRQGCRGAVSFEVGLHILHGRMGINVVF
jgi:DNA polymerase alpha subunit A